MLAGTLIILAAWLEFVVAPVVVAIVLLRVRAFSLSRVLLVFLAATVVPMTCLWGAPFLPHDKYPFMSGVVLLSLAWLLLYLAVRWTLRIEPWRSLAVALISSFLAYWLVDTLVVPYLWS